MRFAPGSGRCRARSERRDGPRAAPLMARSDAVGFPVRAASVAVDFAMSVGKTVAVTVCIGIATALVSGIARPAAAEETHDAAESHEQASRSPIGEITYRPARGLRLGDTGLNIGGFTTLEVDREAGEPAEVALDSVNFLVLYEPIDRFRVFAELEIGDLLEHEAQGPTRSDPVFDVERLYGELSLNDALEFRFGKYQTPIGRWNQVPAEPFVWTALDPVGLETAFDEHQTGLAVRGSIFRGARRIDYMLHGQVVDPLDPGNTPPPANRSVGGRFVHSWVDADLSLGTSYLATERSGRWSHLAGLDLEWRRGRVELLGEALYQAGDLAEREIVDAWLQTRLEVWPGISLVGRYEYFDRVDVPDTRSHVGDVGIVWQPVPWLVIKGTHRFASEQSDDVRRGFASSIAVVF